VSLPLAYEVCRGTTKKGMRGLHGIVTTYFDGMSIMMADVLEQCEACSERGDAVLCPGGHI
jgi:hypothetical protein